MTAPEGGWLGVVVEIGQQAKSEEEYEEKIAKRLEGVASRRGRLGFVASLRLEIRKAGGVLCPDLSHGGGAWSSSETPENPVLSSVTLRGLALSNSGLGVGA